MKKLGLFFLILSLMAPVNPSLGQGFKAEHMEGGFSKYFKKTISFFDYSAIVSKEIVVEPSDTVRKKLAEFVSTQIKLPRFYWESLPETTVSVFKQVVSEKKYSSIEELSSDVQNHVAPELIKILDISKEMRALSLVSEADREKFISTKAKTLGIDAQKVEKVMNSGYVVVPFIDVAKIRRDTVVVKNKEFRVPGVRATIDGGLAIYRVKFKDNQYSIVFAYEIRAKNPYVVFVSTSDYKAKISPQDSAFIVACSGLVRSFDMALREIFKLSAPVVEASFNSVKFDLGKREGVLIDDGFDIYEFVETKTGEINKKNVGFVRVSKVADNRHRKEYSSAQIIIGSIFGSDVIQKGMLAEERPRFPFDFVFGLNAFPVKVSSVDIPPSAFPPSADVKDTIKIKKVSPFAYAGHFDINVNFGKAINKSQLWFVLSANVGLLPLDVNFFGNDVKSGLYGNFTIGLMKKVYFRRLSVAFESRVGVANFKFSAKESSGRDTIEYALSPREWLLHGGVGAGIEFVINPDLNIGVKGLYLLSESTNRWTFLKKIGDDEKRWVVNFGSPVSMSGFSFKVYFNISIKNFAKVRKFED
jgi:hypothetical protein